MASKGQKEGKGGNQGRAMRGLSRWPAAETPHGEHGKASGVGKRFGNLKMYGGCWNLNP